MPVDVRDLLSKAASTSIDAAQVESEATALAVVTCIVAFLLLCIFCNPGCCCYDPCFGKGHRHSPMIRTVEEVAQHPLNKEIKDLAEQMVQAADDYARKHFPTQKFAHVVTLGGNPIASSGDPGAKAPAQFKANAVAALGHSAAGIAGPPLCLPRVPFGLCRAVCCMVPCAFCTKKLFLKGALGFNYKGVRGVLSSAGSTDALADEQCSAAGLNAAGFHGKASTGFILKPDVPQTGSGKTMALFGATGNSGKVFLPHALRAGWTVKALVRDASKLEKQLGQEPQDFPRDRVEAVKGDITRKDDIDAVIKGCDCVVLLAGVPRFTKKGSPQEDLMFKATQDIVESMKANGLRRLMFQVGGFTRLKGEPAVDACIGCCLRDCVLGRCLGETVSLAQNQRIADMLEETRKDIDWILPRPGMLEEKPSRGPVQTVPAGSLNAGTVSFTDLAAWEVSLLADDTFQAHSGPMPTYADDLIHNEGEPEWDPGMYAAPPPCCGDENAPGPCRCLDQSCCCIACGSCGVDAPCGVKRHRWMLAADILTVIGIIFVIVSMYAFSRNPQVVANVPWGVSTFKAGSSLPALNISDAEGYTGYVGLNTLVLADPQGQFVTSVDVSSPVNCTSEYGLEACNQCTQSLNGLHTAIIIGLVTQFPQLITDISRSTHRGDINFHKFIGMFAAFFGGGDQIYTLYSFRNSCSGVGGDAVATYPGISLVLFGLAMAFRYIDFIAHALLKTPPRARGMKDERVEQAAAVERNISSGHLAVSV